MTRTLSVQVKSVSCGVRSGFWFEKKVLLREIDFEIPSGEVTALLGANGAGKTTLLHLLTHVRRADSGTVRVEGSIGYLPERPYFYEHETAEEILLHYASVSGLSRRVAQPRVKELLREVGLAESAKKALRFFSKGMLQRVGIAQSLIHDPQVLILDEPMSGLDSGTRIDLQELISRLAKFGKTVIFTSHSFSDVELLADRILLLEKGQLIRDLKCSEGKIVDASSGENISVVKEVLLRHDLPESWIEGGQKYLQLEREGSLRILSSSLMRDRLIRLRVECFDGFQSGFGVFQTSGVDVVSVQSLGLAQYIRQGE